MTRRSNPHAEQDRLVLAALPGAVHWDTREVATATGLGMAVTRRVLLRLEAAGKVVRLDGTGTGLPKGWRRVVPARDAA